MRAAPIALLLTLAAAAAPAATVKVVDSAGHPVAGALVTPAAGEASAADEAGLVEVPGGPLSVTAEGFLPLDAAAPAETLVLQRPSRVVVRAVDRETGTAVPSGRVRLWSHDGAEPGGQLAPVAPEEPALAEAALVDGRALLGGLPAGSYRVLVEAPGYLGSARAVAPASEAQDELLLRLAEAGVVEGRVLSGGKPVPDARIRVVLGLPEGMAGGRRGPGGRRPGLGPAGESLNELEITSDAQGRYRFDQLPAERRVAFVLVAQAPDLRWTYAVVPPTRFGAGPSQEPSERTVNLDLVFGESFDLSGVVSWSDGEPAIGVPVVAELEQERGGFGRMRRFGVSLSPAFSEWGGGPEAATGPEGEFVLRGLPAGQWRIAARPLEHAGSEPESVELRGDSPLPAPLSIEISRGLSVEGLVVDASGNPIPDASVVGERRAEGRRWPEQVLETEADGRGRFSLSGFESGEVSLLVSAPGFGEKRVEVGLLSEAGPQRVVLTRTGRLFGVVVNAATGEPLTRFTVLAVRAEDDPESSRNRFFGRSRGTEIVSEDGAFEIDEVEEGRWAALVRAEGYLSRVGEPVEVRAGEESDAGRIELVPGATLEGIVVDEETREPIEGATVTVEGIGGRSFGLFGRGGRGGNGEAPSDSTGRDGAFRLDGLPPGEFTISASHHAYPTRGDHSRRVSVGEDPAATLPPLTIELEKGGTVSGRVLGSSGEAVPGALIVATQPDARGRGALLGGPVEADAEGAFVIEALPEGEALVRRADRIEGGVSVQVKKGEVAEVVLREEGTRVFGAVLVSGRPAEARVRLLAASWGAPQSDWGTSYELVGVPAGDWTLRVELRDPADPTAELRDERVQLTVPEGLRELQHDLEFEAEDTSDDAPVEGRVIDADTGEGLAGWMVWARKQGTSPESVRTEDDGSFRLVLPESGEWRMSATGTGEDGASYDAPPTQVVVAENGRLVAPPAVFEAKRRLSLDVRVLDVAGSPVAGATCMLVNKAEHLSPQSGLRLFGAGRAQVTDALGRVRVTASEPGLHDLVVILPARAFVIQPGVRVGGPEFDVQLPRTGTLEVRGARELDLLDLPGEWWMRVRANQQRYGLIETLGDTIRLHGLPGGNYRVRVGNEVRDAEVVPGPTSTVLDFAS